MPQNSLPFFESSLHKTSFYLFLQFHNILEDIFQANANLWLEIAAPPEP